MYLKSRSLEKRRLRQKKKQRRFLISQIQCLHQSWTSELILLCMCVFNVSLYLGRAHLLSITYFPAFPLSSVSFSAVNPAYVGVDNKLGGGWKGWRRNGAPVSLQRAKPNDHKDSQMHKQEPAWQLSVPATSWANKETWYSLLQRSETSLSLCVSGLKSLRAKWIILQLLLQETDIILRLLSPHYIHKSPNLLHTAVRKIITTI